MMQLIQLFRQQGWQVVFASPAALSEHRADLSALGVDEVTIALNCSSFDQYVSKFQPDIVLFDRFMMEEQFGWRVEKCCPQALRVLDTEDLHSLRETRHQILKETLKQPGQAVESLFRQQPAQLYRRMSGLDLAQRELAAIWRCDLTIMISEFETRLLTEQFGVSPDLLVTLPLPVESIPPQWSGFEARQHFVSIGNFRHAPNWDAVLWLKQEIWPRIRQALPEAELHVYGAYPPPKATALHNAREGFLVKGWAPDADWVMTRARVCLAPLRFGAGIKGKLVDAMRCGTPSVTTPIGAEAMSADLDWCGAITETVDEFVAASVQLHEDEKWWGQVQRQGREILERVYISPAAAEAVLSRLEQCRQNLAEHRGGNFIGAMLRHHQCRSTEYMARWIEAKNRLLAENPPSGPEPA